jgi:hypothetical protein
MWFLSMHNIIIIVSLFVHVHVHVFVYYVKFIVP